MKRILFPLTLLSLFAVNFLVTSCQTDGTEDPGGNAVPPEIRFLSASGFISTDSQVSPGETFSVKINAVAGDADLKSLTVKENGTNIPSSRLTILLDGTDVTNNPLLIVDAYASGATWEISIDAPVDAAVRTYEFIVADDDNLTASVSIDVEVFGVLEVSLARGDDDVTVAGQTDYSVNVLGSRGASALFSLAVIADGQLLPADSLLFGGAAVAANPIVLSGSDKEGFDSELIIKTAAKGTKTYTLELADESGATVSTQFDLTVMVEYTALLVNNRDGQQFGGLDLDDGQTVPYNSPIAEIRDKGINLGAPSNDVNWYQQILPVNGAELRVPDLTQSENFSYENATSRGAIVAAFDSGISKTESDVVAVGDLFLVKRDDNYYLLECVEINITNSDNNDYYKFDVKQVAGKE
ncbi:MAG: hypothetical protein R2824_29080 [Saprospiraceae bacterium]|nr:hypothetical protein [Lewinella sp.]